MQVVLALAWAKHLLNALAVSPQMKCHLVTSSVAGMLCKGAHEVMYNDTEGLPHLQSVLVM